MVALYGLELIDVTQQTGEVGQLRGGIHRDTGTTEEDHAVAVQLVQQFDRDIWTIRYEFKHGTDSRR